MHRTSVDAQNGAFVAVQASKHGCEDCEFTWGDKVDFLSVVHEPTLMQKSDKIDLTVDVALDVANSESLLSSVFVGDPLTMKGTCDVCGGSCKFVSARDRDSVDFTMPSLVRDASYCDKPQEDAVLLDHTLQLPDVDAVELQLTGHLNVSMALVRDGSPLSSTTLMLAMLPVENQLGKLDLSKLMPRRPQKEARAEEEEAPTEEEAPAEEEQTLPGLLQLTLGTVLNSVANEVGSTDTEIVEDEADERVNAVITDLQIFHLERPYSNVSLKGENFCRNRGSLGSFGCVTKFGSSNVISTSLHLATELDQGSYMLVSSVPKVTGPLAMMLKRVLAPLDFNELELPLCSEEEVVEYEFKGKMNSIKPFKCGYYALNLELPTKEFGAISENLPLPLSTFAKFLPVPRNLKLKSLPPLSVDVRMQLFHYGGVPIADFAFKVGLDKIL